METFWESVMGMLNDFILWLKGRRPVFHVEHNPRKMHGWVSEEGRAAAARQVHTLEVAGSSPVPPTI